MAEKSHRVEIIVAIIGLIGVLGPVIITNWNTLFPSERKPQDAMKAVRDEVFAKASNPNLGSPHPETPELRKTPPPRNEGYFQRFDRGYVYWSPTTGAHIVGGFIFNKWAELGFEQGLLGFPITDELSTPDGRGRFNHFQGGSIYWTPQTGAHEVHGAIREKWSSMGWERSSLGYPVSDEGSHDSGRVSHFENGVIFWTPEGGIDVKMNAK